jgi:hypothetical protein
MKNITITCGYCGNGSEKTLKEYRRQTKKGRRTFYCTRSCAARANTKLAENAAYCKAHPRETYEKLVSSPNYHCRAKNEFSPFRSFARKVKARSIDSNRATDLKVEDLKEIWDKQNGTCPYTGIRMEIGGRGAEAASLDRIDSSKWYLKDNVEFVCLFINYGKNGFSKDEVKTFLSKLTLR